MNKKTISILMGICAVACVFASRAMTAQSFQATGNVTPSGMKIKVTGASILTADNKEIQVLTGDHELEFTRSGTPFAAVPMSTITVPFGRYIGIKLRFDDRYQVKLNGDKYIGTAQGSLTSGTALYTPTAVADSSAANSASTTVTSSPVYVTLPHVSNCSDCSNTTYLVKPVCVAASEAECQAGDQYAGGDGTKMPDLNVLVDMYQSIDIGPNLEISRGAVYPFAVVGKPGAAIHLTQGSSATNGTKNVSILFGSDKKIASIATWGVGATLMSGPTGGNWVTATAGPSVNAYGPSMFSELTDAGNGTLKFPMGNCPGTTCTSSGLATLTGVLQAVNNTVTFTCTADTTGALGYTYTGGNCDGFSDSTLKVSRIIDPANILGLCTASSGVCSATNAQIAGTTDADGYL